MCSCKEAQLAAAGSEAEVQLAAPRKRSLLLQGGAAAVCSCGHSLQLRSGPSASVQLRAQFAAAGAVVVCCCRPAQFSAAGAVCSSLAGVAACGRTQSAASCSQSQAQSAAAAALAGLVLAAGWALSAGLLLSSGRSLVLPSRLALASRFLGLR